MKKTVFNLETIFSEICTSSTPYEWDENHVSFLLMKELRKLFSRRVISFNSWSKIVDWHSFKNKGKQETNYGDIALIVSVQFTSGEILKGIACIEAKRSYQSGNFESTSIAQLDRIFTKLPYSHLLLYNQNKQSLQQKFPDESTWSSHFWISPINTARQLLTQISPGDNWKILRTSFPFSMFLTARIFWGIDLDFREEILNDILSGENKIIDPSFLGIVNVYYDHQKPINSILTDKWEEI
ncbi:hypothetical protein [Chitinophaga arvensicola]|uniref:Restriction endonuclease n=1 Tax=Chitinophaga arvensicola TaxID=29529 RepID=A0A1I0QJN1_9BACT|nr:hypothetical protein [Chitinophaga arvensicola]SEW27351.1 hypothetical protein SAMN04488122_1520 [Chitinophaga arvensicola]